MTAPQRRPRARRRAWAAVTGAALLLVAALVGATLMDAARASDEPSEPPPFAARPAPVLTGPTLDGEPFDLADLRGQVVLVNVWASWCGPCRDELPLLADAQRRLADRGLRVVGINTGDDEGAARRFLSETGATFPNVVDPDGATAVGWGTIAVPETHVVDRSGQIVDRWFGAVSQEWISTTVEPLLGQP